MASEPLISDPMDPLHSLGGLSLFPRTLRSSTSIPFPSDHKDLDSIHNFMKSMELRSPEKLLDEAKAIVDGGSELLNSKFASFVASLGTGDGVAAENQEKVPERRPGLGRKRPRFSLKPNTSQPSVDVELSFDIDHLQDPEDFYLTYEKLENAKREIQRQRGGFVSDSDVNKPSITARGQRPGLLGKSVRCKHQYSLSQSANDEVYLSSQEILEQDVLGGNSCELDGKEDSPGSGSDDIELASPITKTENRVNKILDELLSCDNEDLDGDKALSLLQERLQIKPIELGTLCIPDFPDNARTEYMVTRERITMSRRKASSDLHAIAKQKSGEAPARLRQVKESSISSLASPTPPKSPFASISRLNKLVLLSNPQRDPFSPLNIDLPTLRNSSSPDPFEKQLDQVDAMESSNARQLKSPMGESIPKVTLSGNRLQKVVTADLENLTEQSVRKNQRDPFSPLNIDQSALRNLSSRDAFEKQLDQVDAKEEFNAGHLKTPMGESILKVTVSGNELKKVVTADLENLTDQSVPKNQRDPFAPLNIDLSALRNLSSRDAFEKQLDQVDAREEFNAGHLKSPIGEGVSKVPVSGNELKKVVTADLENPTDQSVLKNLSRENVSLDERFRGTPHEWDHNDQINTDESLLNCRSTGQETANDVVPAGTETVDCNLSGEPTDADVLSNRPGCTEQKDEKIVRGTHSSVDTHPKANDRTDSFTDTVFHTNQENVEEIPPKAAISEQQDINIDQSIIVENSNSCSDQLDQSNLAASEHRDIDAQLMMPEYNPEKHSEKPSRVNERKGKRPLCERQELKALSRRQSTADRGTTFENGVRRSKRMKVKPLEYWKGERLLYGRVNESLKVIGLKYISPGKGNLKVKSYVPDEYKELVELAARY